MKNSKRKKYFIFAISSLIILIIVNFIFVIISIWNSELNRISDFSQIATATTTILALYITFKEYWQRKESAINEYCVYFYNDSKINKKIIEENQFNSLDLPHGKLIFDLNKIIAHRGKKLEKDDEDIFINLMKKDNFTDSALYATLQKFHDATGVEPICLKEKKLSLNICPLLSIKTREFSEYKFYLYEQIYSLKLYKTLSKTSIQIIKNKFTFFNIKKIKGNGDVSSAEIYLEQLNSKGKINQYKFQLNDFKGDLNILIDLDIKTFLPKGDAEILKFNFEFTNQYGKRLSYELGEAVSKGFDIFHYKLSRNETYRNE